MFLQSMNLPPYKERHGNLIEKKLMEHQMFKYNRVAILVHIFPDMMIKLPVLSL